MPELQVTRTAVRRLAVARQRLAGPLPRRAPTPEDVVDVVRAIRCLQLDPVPVVARSQLLVLRARLGPVAPATLDAAAYDHKALFEYWAHEASLVLVEDLPIFRHRMASWPREGGGEHRARLRAWLDANEPLRAHVLRRLTDDGPLGAADIGLPDGVPVEPWLSDPWGVASDRTLERMLDALWMRGEALPALRVAGRRLWDLAERVLPADAPADRLDPPELTRQAALHAIRALGVARKAHVTKHFTRGRYPDLDAALARLERDGALVRVEVQGEKGPWWTTAEDAEALARDAAPPGAGRTVFLSPFDNLLADRARTEQLWGFHHRLEIYVPKAKRRWGYYVLPLLDGDRLVARADLAVDRAAGLLRVHALHPEPGLRTGAGLHRRAGRDLQRLATWTGATAVALGDGVPAAWSKGMRGTLT